MGRSAFPECFAKGEIVVGSTRRKPLVLHARPTQATSNSLQLLAHVASSLVDAPLDYWIMAWPGLARLYAPAPLVKVQSTCTYEHSAPPRFFRHTAFLSRLTLLRSD